MTVKAFIGSSSESLNIAEALQELLNKKQVNGTDLLSVIWDQGIFGLSQSIFDSLLNNLSKYDFGIFILGADDLIKIRGVSQQGPRDNVVFELGLFFGRLGPQRTFFVAPKGIQNYKLPTDLSGIKYATFTPPSDDTELLASLSPVCNQIVRAMAAV